MLCTAGDEAYAVNSECTTELIRVPESAMTKVPVKLPGLLGLLHHRDKVYPAIELRALLGMQPYMQQIHEMQEFLQAREADHVAWLEALKESVEKGTTFAKPLDPTKCAFGQWYEGLRADASARGAVTGGTIVLEKILEDFDAPHKNIHGIAEEVLALAADGRKDEAQARIALAWDTDLADMKVLFKRLFTSFVELRQPGTILVSVRGIRFALIVDDVESVMSVKDSLFEPAPQLTQGDNRLVESCVNLDGRLVMKLDMEALVALVSPHLALAS